MISTFRECPRCAGESTFRERHLKCVRCGLEYAVNGTMLNDKWRLPADEREIFIEVWQNVGKPAIEGVPQADLGELLDRAQSKETVLAVLNWFKGV